MLEAMRGGSNNFFILFSQDLFSLRHQQVFFFYYTRRKKLQGFFEGGGGELTINKDKYEKSLNTMVEGDSIFLITYKAGFKHSFRRGSLFYFCHLLKLHFNNWD